MGGGGSLGEKPGRGTEMNCGGWDAGGHLPRRSAQCPSVAPPGSSDPGTRLPSPPADPPFTLRPGTCFSLKWLQERNGRPKAREACG